MITLTKEMVRLKRARKVDLKAKDFRIAILWPKFGCNLGTLLRTADAVGASIVVPKLTKALESDLQRGNTIGKNKVFIERTGDPIDFLKKEKKKGIRIVALEIADSSVTPGKIERVSGPTILILGHESLGVPDNAWPYIDQALELPQLGVGNSLNVITAASIGAYLLRGLLDE